MATHSSVLAWKIPGTGESGGLPSPGSHRVEHDWSDLAAAAAERAACLWSTQPRCQNIWNTENLGPHRALNRCPVLYSRFSLVIYFMQSRVYVSIPISQFIPAPISPLGVHTFVLYVCVSISTLQKVGCRLWDRTELGTTEATAAAAAYHFSRFQIGNPKERAYMYTYSWLTLLYNRN